MKPGWLNFAVALSAALVTLDMTVVTIALPAITEHFDAGLDDAQWVVNSYVLVFAALLLAAGALSDRISRRTLFVTGHVIFLGASVVCTFANSVEMLIGGRGMQAVGAALIFATCMPLIADAFEHDEKGRAKAVGVFMAAGAAAAALGPLIGGVLVDSGGWRWIFAVNIPFDILAVVIILTLVKLPPHRATGLPPMDWISTIIIAGALVSLNYVLISGPTDGWTSAGVLIAAGLALLLFAIFVIIQDRKGSRGLLDLSLFKIPSFSAAVFLSFTGRLVTFGLLPFLIFWMTGDGGLSSIQIGCVMLAIALPLVFFAGPSALLERTGKVNLVTAVAMVITAAGLLWAMFTLDAESTWRSLVGPLIAIGVGSGLAVPHMMNIAIAVVPAAKSGMASGVTNTALPLGTSTGVAVFGAVLTSHIDELDAPQQVKDATAAGRFDLLAPAVPPENLHTLLETFMDGITSIFALAAVAAAVCAAV